MIITRLSFPKPPAPTIAISFNSLTQFDRYKYLVKKNNPEISIGLRINPEYSEVGTALYNPCAPGTRFGINSKILPEILPDEVEGFHCHCHCESGSDVFERTLVKIEEKVTKEAKKVEKETGISHELVNLLDDKSARKEPEDPLPIFVRKLFPNLIVEEVREKIRKEHRPVYDMDGNDHNTIAEAERANVLIKQRILTQHVKIMVDMEYNRQEAEALKKG